VLHIHQNTVIRYIKDGKLPAVKVGKAYRIKERKAFRSPLLPAGATVAGCLAGW
jgi:hypothetical protein